MLLEPPSIDCTLRTSVWRSVAHVPARFSARHRRQAAACALHERRTSCSSVRGLAARSGMSGLAPLKSSADVSISVYMDQPGLELLIYKSIGCDA